MDESSYPAHDEMETGASPELPTPRCSPRLAARKKTATESGIKAADRRAAQRAILRRPRGSKYSDEEVDGLLETCEEYLPIGPEEWEVVATLHKHEFPNKDRDRDSLRRKFLQFANSKKETGNPDCPPQIRRAKKILRDIVARTDAGDDLLDEDLGFVEEEVEGEEDEEGSQQQQTNKQGSGQNRTTAGAGAGQQNTSTAGVSGAPPPGVSARLMSPRPMVMPRGAGGSAGSGMDQLLQFMVANNQLKESREETERKERRELMEQKEAAREAERKERMERDEADRRERREERQLQQQQQQQQQQFMNLLMMQLVGKRNSPRILQEEKDDME